NAHTYLDDCRIHKINPSLPQLLLMFYHVDCILAIPGPKAIRMPIGRFLNWFGGVVIGSWLLGYSHTYEEYYRPKKV
ncbi:hypothetical protein M501DRAFT_940495, partial [Patellaria atrata CBS 101060]